jgi:hypothetical protein
MNPKEWRDYLKTPGLSEYRVVAVACEDTDDGSSDSIPVVVVINDTISVKGLTYNTYQDISIYPVPASELVQVSSTNLVGSEVRVLNIQGKEIKRLGKVNTNILKIQTNDLNSGVYIIQIKGKDGMAQKRFTVQ